VNLQDITSSNRLHQTKTVKDSGNGSSNQQGPMTTDKSRIHSPNEAKDKLKVSTT